MYIIEFQKDIEKYNIGEFPQIQEFKASYNEEGNNSIYNTKYNIIPSFQPDLDGLMLHKDAILTDVLGFFFSDDLIMNEKVKNIFLEYNLPEYRLYAANLFQEKIKIDPYYWFYYISNGIDYIDYNHSTFIIKNYFTNPNPQGFKIQNKEELLKIQKRISHGEEEFTLKKIALLQEIEQVDFFDFGFLSLKKYVSESLGKRLISEKITGINIKKAENIEIINPIF